MAQRILYGNINADGKKYSGSTGWKPHKDTSPGVYLIDFDPAFADVPTVILTQNYKSWDDFTYGGGKTTDNAVLIAVDSGLCKYVTGDSGGGHSDRNCGFIAVGAAED